MEELEEILLDQPILQFYLHQQDKTEKYEDNEENNTEEYFQYNLRDLCNDLLTPEELEQIGGDYKLQLFHLANKINAISAERSFEHGLFGKLHGKFGNINDYKRAKQYIDHKSQKGTVMYHSLISFSPEKAKSLGLFNAEVMKKQLRENILIVSDKIGIPPSRLEYVASVHLKPSNPHVHFMFWDKEQGVQSAFVHTKVAKEIC